MGLTSVLVFMVLIGTSTQAPRRHDVDDEIDDRSNEQVTRDETTSSFTSSSVNEDDQESTRDELPENNDSEVDDDNEDSVASFVKKSAVSKPQLGEFNEGDSVASYIALKDQNDAVARNEIPKKNEEENDDSGASNDDDNDDDEDDNSGHEPLGINGDSVAAYIVQDASVGTTRHQIPNDKDKSKKRKTIPKKLDGDSVASFISQKSQETGETKDSISDSPMEDDSVASYISIGAGSTRHKIPESNIEPNTDGGSKSDSVGSYINLEDNKKQQSPTSEASGEDIQSGDTQDEEDTKSQKEKEILEGLEDLSTEHKKKPQNQLMDDLSPDVIVPHQMVGELWMERSYAPQDYSPPVVTMNTTSYPYQANNIQYSQSPQYMYQPQYRYVDITRAAVKGAVCLDGSTPGFFYRQGLDTGANKWIIYLQGGAWCHSKLDCYYRSQTNLGSSLQFNDLVNVEGLLSRDAKSNPNFYNWNAVYVPYCDGASYTGNRTKPLKIRGRKIYFRGKRILSALMDDLLDHGLKEADKVIFSGTSAGGLAVLLHADYVRSRIPAKVNVYSLSDAGIFLNAANLKKQKKFGAMMSNVFKLHRSSSCVSKRCKKHFRKSNEWKCMFPRHFGKYIKSPVFIVNPLYDSWQLGNVIGISCTKNLHKCSSKEMAALIKFRKKTLRALEPLMDNPHISLFADGCFDHGQIIFGPKWNNIRVKNRSMSGSFVRWMMKEERVRNIVDPDSDELFNPTCVVHQMKLSKKSFMHS